MIIAVNNAAETARLVLDQAANEIVADDSRSISSHGSRRSVGSANSIHSFNSRRSSGSINGLGMGDHTNSYQIPLIAGEEAQLEEDDTIDNTAHSVEPTSVDSSFKGDSFMRSDTSCEIGGAAFSPPPTAFQNLPMRRGFTPSHNTSGDNRNDDVLAEGKLFEVTNHFDAAAAISAALASSHLAQATEGVLELQMPKHPSHKRSSSDVVPTPTTKLRRSYSGDAVMAIVKSMQESDTYVDTYVPTKKGSGGQDSPPSRRSASLPTPEEAEAEMLSKRSSWYVCFSG